ncbi:FHA domain-containing protein [Oryzifoliimicrobium ureilyticus]|uniref:FHA domain-containing protein n=1 Tax=Oryzifoliimicrobium ureilyticus TaxID=3113724 RepID=UPI0030765ADD
MKLIFRESGASPASNWTLEHGRRSIGRAADCDWQIDDSERRISKLHCIISRDRNGFILTDKSANGTYVNGNFVQEGDSVRLAHGSRIEMAGRAFDVTIAGDPEIDVTDPDPALRMSDETPTISSILADIAPGGRTSRSVLGDNRLTEELPQSGLEDSGRVRKTISRNVEIGWSEPPSSSNLGPVLPDDWDADPTDSSVHEHTDARHIAVRLPRAQEKKVAADFEDVFPIDEQRIPEEPRRTDGQLQRLERLKKAVDRLEAEIIDSLALLDIDYAPQAVAREEQTEAALVARIDDLAVQQRALAAALETMMAQCTQQLEPRLIEAKAELEPQTWQGWLKRSDHWAHYKQQFEHNGRQLSVREFLQKAARGEIETDTQGVTQDQSGRGEGQQDET